MFRPSVLKHLLLAGSLCWLALPASAHEVEVSGDMGGTLHIEPNDTARAGEPTQVWFALTKKGGQVIPLSDCDCQLTVYAEPGKTVLTRPTLTAQTVEGYKGIPGAQVTFPKVGSYTLVVAGKPKQADAFQPFKLPFEVAVATAAPPEAAPSLQPTPGQPSEVLGINSKTLPPAAAPLWQPSIVAVSLILIAGLVWGLLHRLRDDDSNPPPKG